MKLHSPPSTQYPSVMPEYLISAANTLREMGFNCQPSAHDGYGIGFQRLPTQLSLVVLVSKDDPRFLWDSNNVHTTPFVAGVHPQRASVISPRGFEFSPGALGEIALVARITSVDQAADFVDCFKHPSGPNGKITGPRSKPATPVESVRSSPLKSPRP